MDDASGPVDVVLRLFVKLRKEVDGDPATAWAGWAGWSVLNRGSRRVDGSHFQILVAPVPGKVCMQPCVFFRCPVVRCGGAALGRIEPEAAGTGAVVDVRPFPRSVTCDVWPPRLSTETVFHAQTRGK